MPTRCASASRSANRFPVTESLLQDFRLQPYIHNCEVSVIEGRHTYKFSVFFKRHCRLHLNPLLGGDVTDFHGDAVVMRVGIGAMVNMRSRDTGIADYMMKRSVASNYMMLCSINITYSFAHHVGRMARSRPPCSLIFVKSGGHRFSARIRARQLRHM